MTANNQYQYGRGVVKDTNEMPLCAAKKLAGGHKVAIPEADNLIQFADALKCVDRIVLGPIRNMKSLRPGVKFLEVGAGWKTVVCSGSSRQEVFFYTPEKEQTLTEIYTRFPELKPAVKESK